MKLNNAFMKPWLWTNRKIRCSWMVVVDYYLFLPVVTFLSMFYFCMEIGQQNKIDSTTFKYNDLRIVLMLMRWRLRFVFRILKRKKITLIDHIIWCCWWFIFWAQKLKEADESRAKSLGICGRTTRIGRLIPHSWHKVRIIFCASPANMMLEVLDDDQKIPDK